MIFKCRALPPKTLYHLVLSHKRISKLMILCVQLARTLCSKANVTTVWGRGWLPVHGSGWGTKHCRKGVIFDKAFEFWNCAVEQCNENSGGLLTDYTNMFFLIWNRNHVATLSWCRVRMIRTITWRSTGKLIELLLSRHPLVPGQRTLARLYSMWRKWVQNTNKTQTILVRTDKEFYM